MILNDLIGKKIGIMILNQGQETLAPRLRIEGILKGVDQGTYIISRDENGKEEILVVPIGICRLNTME
ncbi:MAG: hypothetical protein M1616_03150 [Candidatus Thermoplasmatota archaeon]|jgi:hypothetical protein|nr:hypothetical protein [Candidatus Thermoplasmatota archaeon]